MGIGQGSRTRGGFRYSTKQALVPLSAWTCSQSLLILIILCFTQSIPNLMFFFSGVLWTCCLKYSIGQRRLELRCFDLTGASYLTFGSMYLANNGHTAVVTFDTATCYDIPTVIQGGLPGNVRIL